MSANYIRKTGAALATGADMDVADDKVGFRPSHVKIYNVTQDATLEWNDSMPAGTGFLMASAGTGSYIATGGITQLATGFTLGTAAEINDTANDVLHFFSLG